MFVLTELQEYDLKNVHGGFGFFSEISKIFGREGKPFIGKDIFGYSAAGGAAVVTAAMGHPELASGAAQAAKEISDRIYDNNK